MDEKRKYPRKNQREDMYIEVATQNEAGSYSKKVIGCESVNVSKTGLKLYVRHRIMPETVLDLCLSFKDNPEKFYLTAEVKWSQPLIDDGWYFVGFEIYESDHTDYKKWYKWVNQSHETKKGPA